MKRNITILLMALLALALTACGVDGASSGSVIEADLQAWINGLK